MSNFDQVSKHCRKECSYANAININSELNVSYIISSVNNSDADDKEHTDGGVLLDDSNNKLEEVDNEADTEHKNEQGS